MYILSYLFLFFIIIWPKINLIGIPGSNTGIRLEDFFIALLLFITIHNLIRNKKYRLLYEDKISFTWIIFILWSLIITLAGCFIFHRVNITSGILYLGRFIEFYVIYLFVRIIFRDNKKLKYVFIVTAAATTVTVIYGLLQRYDMVPYYSTLQSIYDPETGGFTKATSITFSMVGVIMSTFGGHYDFGIFLVFIFSFLISGGISLVEEYKWEIVNFRKKQNVYLMITALLCFLIIIYCIIYSGSRSAYLALLLLLIIIGTGYSRYFAIIPFSILTFLGFKFFQGKLGNLPGLIKIGNFNFQVDLSTVIRLNKWSDLLFNNSPLLLCLGMGLSSQGEAMDGYYIRLLGETGIAGLFLFGLLMFNILKTGRSLGFSPDFTLEEKILGKGIFWGTLALIIQGVFIDTFVSSKIMYIFWFLTGLSAALYSKRIEKADV